MTPLPKLIREELKKHIDLAYKKSQERFFKEGIELLGVRIGIVRNIARAYWVRINKLDKQDVFALCEELLQNNLQEDSVIAYDWALRMRKQFERKDFAVFERWLKTYVNNWAKCDDLCTGAMGELIAMYPELLLKTIPWQRSKNRWVKRGAAVSLIVPAKRTNILREVFAVSDALLADEDDLVRKGYGWLLKEASNVYPNEVFAYVIKNKANMPRVALRYAIEKMPAAMKKQAMAR